MRISRALRRRIIVTEYYVSPVIVLVLDPKGYWIVNGRRWRRCNLISAMLSLHQPEMKESIQLSISHRTINLTRVQQKNRLKELKSIISFGLYLHFAFNFSHQHIYYYYYYSRNNISRGLVLIYAPLIYLFHFKYSVHNRARQMVEHASEL